MVGVAHAALYGPCQSMVRPAGVCCIYVCTGRILQPSKVEQSGLYRLPHHTTAVQQTGALLQVIRPQLLSEGFEAVKRDNLEVTDDVSIIEAIGKPVKMTQGAYANIKAGSSSSALLQRCCHLAGEMVAACHVTAMCLCQPRKAFTYLANCDSTTRQCPVESLRASLRTPQCRL